MTNYLQENVIRMVLKTFKAIVLLALGNYALVTETISNSQLSQGTQQVGHDIAAATYKNEIGDIGICQRLTVSLVDIWTDHPLEPMVLPSDGNLSCRKGAF